MSSMSSNASALSLMLEMTVVGAADKIALAIALKLGHDYNLEL
jgi:hypothetical protein